ncbi:neuromedin-U isoform X2 [Denticeps clupeoides]|uniref:neuromedin-U isoform X2 n=1 Tax=Denticeps clupeoides TaxID=299321 RepID=UPI0010A4B0AE|nr:neuromedin-U isoform X2 [Denticeps clupeoides]
MMKSGQSPTGVSISASLPSSAVLAPAVLLLLLAIPVCKSAPVVLQQPPVNHEQLLNQIDDLCSYYLSADLPLQASDVLAETCFFMLEALQKHQDSTARDHSKREDVQGPGGIQSRGYFLYRPRNGRRSSEYV